MMRFLIITCFLNATTNLYAQKDYREFILKAEKISKKYLDSVFGEAAVSKGMRLSEEGTIIRNFNGQGNKSLKDYANDFPPSAIEFAYDVVYKGDTMTIMGVTVNDSLQVMHEAEEYIVSDFLMVTAWRHAMLGEFTFNYDDLQRFIKNDRSIDTCYKQINPGYIFAPKAIVTGKKTFVEVQFTWSITVYSSIKYPGDNFITENEIRDIQIDANTGKKIEDKLVPPIKRMPL